MAPNSYQGRYGFSRRRQNAWSSLTVGLLISAMSWAPISHAAHSLRHSHPHKRATIADGVELRVLPIGDSITYGVGYGGCSDSTCNGYRKALYTKLTEHGNKVDFVGSNTSGDFADTDHEGHRGEVIDTIKEMASTGISAAPNIILVHAGTNDINRALNVGSAPSRLTEMIEAFYEVNSDALVLVCKIVPSKNASAAADLQAFNDAIPGVVEGFSGKNIAMVDMFSDFDTSTDLHDALHPNTNGYDKMTERFYDAIIAADSDNMISEPGEAQDPSENCRTEPSWYKIGQVATGPSIAESDGEYIPGFVERGVIAKGACSRAMLHLMDFDGDGLPDYACVDPDTGAVNVHINNPDGDGKSQNNWSDLGEVATGKKGRDGTGVMFGDLNGDGRDDYIYVDPDSGDVYGWINQWKQDDEWLWQSLGKIAGGVGATNKTLQMVDIDGDGRDDFCLVNLSTGEVQAWLNTGTDVVPDYHKLGVIATGATATSSDKVWLGDFTGEGRADYMIVGSGGKTTGFINRLQESSMIPKWSTSVDLAKGPTDAKQAEVRFADMTGDGKVDYLLIDEDTGEIRLWENLGTQGKYQIGEGTFLCDLNGDGTSDYFWVNHTGEGWGFLNTGKGTDEWKALGQTAKTGGFKREQIRMGVLTHSKRADFIVVDDENGRAEWWQNLGEDWDYNWASQGECATGPRNTIETKFGWTFDAKNIRFADLNGDGYDDFLYINERGAVAMWPNSQKNPIEWGEARIVADGVDVAPQDIRFADTNGDGKLDYVTVGRTSGKARTWHNLGMNDDGSIRWNTPLDFAAGPGPVGRSIQITEMTGDSRADYVSVNPDSGALTLWHNRCWPKSGTVEPSPGEEDDDDGVDWTDLTCNSEGADDATMDGVERWNKLKADQAWEDCLADWEEQKDKEDRQLEFAATVSQFLGGAAKMECEKLNDDNGCKTTAQTCSDSAKGPAELLITSSFRAIDSMLWNMYEAIGTAQSNINSDMGTFSKTYAPVKKDEFSIFVILDLATLGYAAMAAPIWNRWIKNVNWASKNANDFDTVKDFLNDMTYQGVTLAKDMLAASSEELTAGDTLATRAAAMINALRESLTKYAATLFSGKDDPIALLTKILASGKMISPELTTETADTMTEGLEKSLYALLIPMAWKLSERELNPFIIDSKMSCSVDLSETDLSYGIDEDAFKTEVICDTSTDRKYILLSSEDPGGTCSKTFGCPDFNALPGTDVLSSYGGISREDIVLGSVATFNKRSGYNVDGQQSYNNKTSLEEWGDTIENLADVDIRAPYVFTLPICTLTQARKNLNALYSDDPSDRPYYFPCSATLSDE